jgi:hypothetical protein
MAMGPQGMMPPHMVAMAADGSMQQVPMMPPGHPPGPPMMSHSPGVSGPIMVATPPREGGGPGVGPGGHLVGQMQMGGPGMAPVMMPPGVPPGAVPPHPPPHPMGPGGQAHRVGGPVPVHSGPPPVAGPDGRQQQQGDEGQYQRGQGREHGPGQHRPMYR